MSEETDNQPLVSIVTPSYNQGQFIEETILSVKNQDYPNIEHIIVDGGSTDNTLEVLKKYEGTYNMRWISEPDEGQADAVNKGFRIVKGEIVGWLNSDDVYLIKDAVSHVVDEFSKYENVDVIYGDNIYVNSQNDFLGARKMLWWDYNRALRGVIPSQPSAFFRKRVVNENQLDENLNFVMDLEFWLRLGNRCKIKHTNKIISADRLHDQTKRSTLKYTGSRERAEVLKSYKQEINLRFYITRNLVDFPLLVVWRLFGIRQLLTLNFEKTAIEIKTKEKHILVFRQLNFMMREVLSRLRQN